MGQLDWTSINLDRASREALGDQLAAAIEARIETGLVAEGERLPTTRELAGLLRVNRGTVQAAYRRLADRGIIEARVGSGTIVRSRTGTRPTTPPFSVDRLLSDRAQKISGEQTRPLASPVLADFSRLTPDERFFPLKEFIATLTAAWSREPGLWQYAPPLGFEPLREEISRRLASHGVHRAPDEILVTSGAQQGLDLIFRTFTDPGDRVALESPTYSGALALARFADVETIELPMGPEGPDVSALIGRRRVKLAYLMPERQNPTGVTTIRQRREDLVAAATAAGALLIEDGYEEPESGLPPLAALAPERTVWLGTLSKDLVPGFRIGWLAAPAPIIDRLARVKKTADFQTPLPLQAAVVEFLREGSDRKARHNRSLDVELRRIAAVRALQSHLPEISWWGGEIGNALFWLHLPPGVSGRGVADAAAARGVGVAPGYEFDPQGEDRPNLRLSVSRVDQRQVDAGVRRLAEAIHAVAAQSGVRSVPVV
ncbi:MAG TPA: PLP-dependent aminotransferase family protein [Thermoanaerobaculia bacterium]